MRTSGAFLVLLFCLGCDDRSDAPKRPTPDNVAAQADNRPVALPALNDSNVASVAFSPDGRLLVSSNRDGTMRVWNVQSGQLMTSNVAQVWSAPLQRYDPKRIDNMPQVGPDNFKILQDQIDALEQRIQRLERAKDAERQP